MDFFISYRTTDRSWAEWIAWQLKDAGFEVMIQAWHFRNGSPVVDQINAALAAAACTVSVLSPDYFQSPWCKLEWQAALTLETKHKGHRLLPVLIRDGEFPPVVEAKTWVELAGVEEAEARQRLLDAVTAAPREPAEAPAFPPELEPPPEDAPRFPGALPRLCNLTHRRNADFIGRDKLLQRLHAALNTERTAAVTQAIHGQGGIGKTQLAIEYIYRHTADYDIAWWIRCEDAGTRTADLAALAGPLDLAERDAQDQTAIVEAVRRELARRHRWLLVLDNVNHPEDIDPIVPVGGGGKVLITSRDPTWRGRATSLPVDVFTRDQSVRYLLGDDKRRDDEQAQALAAELGDLPLALAEAAAYIDETGESLAGYMDLFRGDRQRLWQQHTGPLGHQETVAVTYEISLRRIADEQPRAEELLNLCAFLAPENIPRDLLLRHVNGDTLLLNDVLKTLRRYSLAEVGQEGISIHRLIQAVCRDRLTDEEQFDHASAAVLLLNNALPGDANTDLSVWPTYESLLPHILSAVGHAESLSGWDSSSGATGSLSASAEENTGGQATSGIRRASVRLLNQIAIYLHTRANFAQAEPLMRRALEIGEQSYGQDHPEVAIVLNNLAQLLQDTNRLDEAEPLMRRALGIDKQSYGEDHSNVASNLSNLAALLLATNRLDEAEPLMRRALEIDERSYGKGHRKVAIRLNNLAQLLKDTNRLDEAEPLMRRVLEIYEQSYGKKHPNYAVGLTNLGHMLQVTKRLSEAESLYRQALSISEGAHEKVHPEVARCCSLLAESLFLRGEISEAEPLMCRALEIDEQAYGKRHPAVAVRLNNLAILLQHTNRLDEAEPLIRRALKIDEQSYGKNHPEVALRLNNLAHLLMDSNQLDKAEPIIRRAIDIFAAFELATGYAHPHVKAATWNYERLLQAMGLNELEIKDKLADLLPDEADLPPE